MILQAVIIQKVGDLPDGELIKVVEPAWRAILDYLSRDQRARYELGSRKLEELIAGSYWSAGFDEVILTPRSGDHGRDVIATMTSGLQLRIIDSVKATGEGKLVRHDDVRALLGVLSGDQKASKGVVTTTSDFAPGIRTDPFIAPFLPSRLQLVNGEELAAKLEELRKKKR